MTLIVILILTAVLIVLQRVLYRRFWSKNLSVDLRYIGRASWLGNLFIYVGAG